MSSLLANLHAAVDAKFLVSFNVKIDISSCMFVVRESCCVCSYLSERISGTERIHSIHVVWQVCMDDFVKAKEKALYRKKGNVPEGLYL